MIPGIRHYIMAHDEIWIGFCVGSFLLSVLLCVVCYKCRPSAHGETSYIDLEQPRYPVVQENYVLRSFRPYEREYGSYGVPQTAYFTSGGTFSHFQ